MKVIPQPQALADIARQFQERQLGKLRARRKKRCPVTLDMLFDAVNRDLTCAAASGLFSCLVFVPKDGIKDVLKGYAKFRASVEYDIEAGSYVRFSWPPPPPKPKEKS